MDFTKQSDNSEALLAKTKAELQLYQVQLHELKSTRPGKAVYKVMNTGSSLAYLVSKKDVEEEVKANLIECEEGLKLLHQAQQHTSP
eukprot:CFRG7499T1